MTVLGEAFIEVRGDLRPFIRDLDKELKHASDQFEKNIKTSLSGSFSDLGGDGEKLGEKLGDGVGRGMGRRLGDKGKPPWVNITAALASALDDGISALPAEAKASIVLGIMAALPIVSAALAGAVSAGLGAGLAVAGVAIATQFEEVREEATLTGNLLRESLIRAAEPFALQTVRALELIQGAFLALEDRFTRIFGTASTFLEPLTKGLLDAFNFITESIDRVSNKLAPFVDELAYGFGILGDAIGEALEILVNTGEDGQEGLRDLLFLIGLLIVGAAELVAVLARMWGWLRDMEGVLQLLAPPLAAFIHESDRARFATGELGDANILLSETADAAAAATKAEEKAIKDAARAMDEARDAAFGLVDANIAYEESLDNLRDAFRENGRTLAFETEAGRDNLRALGDAIREAQGFAEERFQQGQLNAAQAQEFYRREVDEILRIARAHGVSESAIRGVYGEALKLVNLPTPSSDWLTNLSRAAATAAGQLERAAQAKHRLSLTGAGSGGRFVEYAEGGIVDHPTQALIGEAGPEVVIPLTRPARAAELMRMSGLDKMLQPAVPMVQVFVGNEQLDARTYRIVSENNSALSNSVAFGARGL